MPARDRPPLAAPGIRRVALIGDSIMFQPSCAIAESLADIGIQTSRNGKPVTGLLNGGIDWLPETRRILATEKPDVVVAIFVGNYPAPPARTPAGAVIADDSREFFTATAMSR